VSVCRQTGSGPATRSQIGIADSLGDCYRRARVGLTRSCAARFRTDVTFERVHLASVCVAGKASFGPRHSFQKLSSSASKEVSITSVSPYRRALPLSSGPWNQSKVVDCFNCMPMCAIKSARYEHSQCSKFECKLAKFPFRFFVRFSLIPPNLR